MISKRSKIFLTGHKGLVGSEILRKLIQTGYTNILITPPPRKAVKLKLDGFLIISYNLEIIKRKEKNATTNKRN